MKILGLDIINVTEQYNRYKTKLNREKNELREYELFDSHFGLNSERIKELKQSINQTEKNLNILLNSNIKDIPVNNSALDILG